MSAPQHSPDPGPLEQDEVDLPEGARLRPLGTVAKRTRRQRFLLSMRYHPLSPAVRGRQLRLHPAAPVAADRKMPGPRCGSCRWLGDLDEDVAGSFRCWINNGERVTRGGATEVRAWWPGCKDWEARPRSDTPPADG